MAYDWNIGWNWLNEMPEVGYQGWLSGMPWQQQNYWSNQYGDIYNRYIGQLAQSVMKGGDPTQTWMDYLQGMDVNKLYGESSPSKRGERPWAFNPTRRWLVY